MDLTNHFLLSMPSLGNSWFDKTLSYIYEHDDEGALGFVINRPGTMNAGDIYDQLQIDCTNSTTRAVTVYEGGPIDVERGFVLHPTSDSDHFFESQSSNGGQGVSLSGSTDLLAHVGAGQGPSHYLLLLGYAGWGAGQLEAEVASNAWLTCEAQLDILFKSNPENRLEMAAQSLGIQLSMLSADAGHA